MGESLTEADPFDRRAYCPRTVTNCKSEYRNPKRARWNQRARREYARLLRGMQWQPCWFVTLKRKGCMDLELRRHAWHRVSTRLHQVHPSFAAWTGYEYERYTGVHLHAVVKGMPETSLVWLRRVVALLGDGTEVDVRPVTDAPGLARYLTKQLTNSQIVSAWPRNFHPVSVTRNWCPEWQAGRRLVEMRRRSGALASGAGVGV